MYWQKELQRIRFGLYFILAGVILFVVGLFAEGYHVFSFSPVGYLTGVSYPLYLVGIGLIVISLVLFLIGFYLILREKIMS
jgi:hypothetical protein